MILDNLLIGYDKPLLGELNYKLYKNKKIAILGRNGVGKSTLLKTILGQQKSLGGSYKWNLSADINYFRQEENEFDDVNPINYLRYFYHLKTDGELRSILAKVGIGADLCLKPIKELSGGERQRISIARALLKDAPIVLLDEATASLDVENETKVQAALSRLLVGKTVLVIAHRMRTVAGADHIVVLDNGHVVEQGSPSELMEKNGIYRRMVDLQSESAQWKMN